MNPLIAAEWAEYLKTNAHRQGEYGLQNVHDGKLCCLGALCELAILNGVDVQTHTSPRLDWVQYNGNSTELPTAVQKWAEMKDAQGYLEQPITIDGFTKYSLIALNDSGVPWPQIADIILERWAEL